QGWQSDGLDSDHCLYTDPDAGGNQQDLYEAWRDPQGDHPSGEEREPGGIHQESPAWRPQHLAVLRQRRRLTEYSELAMFDRRRTLAAGVLALLVAMNQVGSGHAQGQRAGASQAGALQDRGAGAPQGRGAGAPQGRGGGGGRGAAFTPAAGAKDLKSVLV